MLNRFLISGSEIAERLLKRKRAPKVILMSGCSPEILGHRVPKGSGVFCLQKPLTADTLARLVRDSLDED